MPTPFDFSTAGITTDEDVDRARDLACELVYRFLAGAFSDPRSMAWHDLLDECNRQLAIDAADFLRSEFPEGNDPVGFGELPAEELNLRQVMSDFQRTAGARDAEFVRVYGLVSCRECPPYETEYNTLEDTFFRSQQMADIGGFYRAFGLEPGGDCGERPDHLVLELEFSALLLTKKRLAIGTGEDERTTENAAICQEARVAFFRDHFGWWTPSFSAALRRKAGSGVYEALGRVLAAFVSIERRRLRIPPAQSGVRPQPAERFEEPEGCLVQLAGLPPGGHPSDQSD